MGWLGDQMGAVARRRPPFYALRRANESISQRTRQRAEEFLSGIGCMRVIGREDKSLMQKQRALQTLFMAAAISMLPILPPWSTPYESHGTHNRITCSCRHLLVCRKPPSEPKRLHPPGGSSITMSKSDARLASYASGGRISPRDGMLSAPDLGTVKLRAAKEEDSMLFEVQSD